MPLRNYSLIFHCCSDTIIIRKIRQTSARNVLHWCLLTVLGSEYLSHAPVKKLLVWSAVSRPWACLVKAWSPIVEWRVAFTMQGRREEGTRGTCSLRNSYAEIFLSLHRYRICDIQSDFQHVFRVSGNFVPDPIRGSPLGTERPLLSPSETNSWLHPYDEVS